MGKGEQTKQQIVGAAFELFITNGYHGTSVRQIAEKAGIALGGVYNHFAGKEEIFLEVVRAYHPFMTVFPNLGAAEGETAEQLVRSAAHKVIAQLEARPQLLNLFFIEMIELEGRHLPALVNLFAPSLLDFLQKVYQYAPEIRPESPLVLFRGFAGMILGYWLTHQLLPAQLPIPISIGTLDDLLTIYLHGVLKNTQGESDERG